MYGYKALFFTGTYNHTVYFVPNFENRNSGKKRHKILKYL